MPTAHTAPEVMPRCEHGLGVNTVPEVMPREGRLAMHAEHHARPRAWAGARSGSVAVAAVAGVAAAIGGAACVA